VVHSAFLGVEDKSREMLAQLRSIFDVIMKFQTLQEGLYRVCFQQRRFNFYFIETAAALVAVLIDTSWKSFHLRVGAGRSGPPFLPFSGIANPLT